MTSSDSGIEIAVMTVARTESRKMRMTTTAKTRPSTPSLTRSSIDCLMNGAWSNTVWNATSSLIFSSMSGSASLTPSEMSTMLPSGFFMIVSDSAGSPFVREIVCTSASRISTSATSLSSTGSSPPGSARSAIWSTVVSRAPTVTGVVLSPSSRSPAEVGMPLDCRMPASTSALSPSSSSLSSSTSMTTSFSGAPVTSTSRTPSTRLSSGTATSSSSWASASGLSPPVTVSIATGMSEVEAANTSGSEPSGSWGWTWETARCSWRTISSEEVPYFVSTIT